MINIPLPVNETVSFFSREDITVDLAKLVTLVLVTGHVSWEISVRSVNIIVIRMLLVFPSRLANSNARFVNVLLFEMFF